jgi:hypothetical protein
MHTKLSSFNFSIFVAIVISPQMAQGSDGASGA